MMLVITSSRPRFTVPINCGSSPLDSSSAATSRLARSSSEKSFLICRMRWNIGCLYSRRLRRRSEMLWSARSTPDQLRMLDCRFEHRLRLICFRMRRRGTADDRNERFRPVSPDRSGFIVYRAQGEARRDPFAADSPNPDFLLRPSRSQCPLQSITERDLIVRSRGNEKADMPPPDLVAGETRQGGESGSPASNMPG